MLILFIGKEEEDYRNDNIKFDNSLEIKINSESLYKKRNNNINNLNIFDDSNENIIRKWLTYNNYSCMHDTFFSIYTFIIRSEIYSDNNVENIIHLYNLISDDILNISISELKGGIWNILNRYKINYDFSSFELKKNILFFNYLIL